MTYNIDFLIAAVVILLLILWYFLGQKRAEDLNNQIFLFFAVSGIMDVISELVSNYYIASGGEAAVIPAIFSITIFYVFQTLLPFAMICYVQTLHENRMIPVKKMLLSGIPSMGLLAMVLMNPFTGLLFSYDAAEGYTKGPWYLVMYYSAICHIVAALLLVMLWKKALGPKKIKVLLEILVICGCGVVVQLVYHPLLTTGFGVSLGILALFITINNPSANTDSLTGSYNHQYFIRNARERMIRGRSFHVITVYLYQLKHINKIKGIQGGDHVLKLTAEKLGKLCGKKVFRITGKRFLIFADSAEEYENDLKRLKHLFEVELKKESKLRNISMPAIISGILHVEKLKESGLILEYAEYLESLSSQNGFTEVIQDDHQTMKGFLYNKKVEQYLHTAIQEDLFEVHYQPVYSTKEKRFITLEALSRLHHPELGWIAPDLFIQIAERYHMIEQITDLQFQRICRFLNENRTLMKQLLNVKVNLSSLDLMRDDCSSHFIHLMDKYGIPYDWVQFEITETVATEYNAGLQKVVDELAAAGICLCLDDFGSGYANLNTVMRLPFSVIKLDRSLLTEICSNEKRAMFYQSIVRTFQRMQYNIVSEGVETEAEMEKLSGWGVDMIQGYYFSKPLPPEELLTLLRA